ncbi:MAG TPA: acyltransferase [Thermoanaerobaculia bacterium]|nr:acyltransferase [Thermoanaerobaculia bacterium]
MKPTDVQLPDDLRELWEQLVRLRAALRDETWHRFGRVNPSYEDLFDWKEKGAFVRGNNVTVYDSTTVVGDVAIGDNTWIGPFCSLDGTGGLAIGSYCSISAGTHIQTHDTVRYAVSGGRLPYEYAPVRIGDCCFIGVNAVILKGVTIGAHSIVGAGAVVTHDIEPYSIVAGVPARKIGTVVDDGETVRLELENR